MIVATTPTLEGKRITVYHGLANGRVVLGTDLVKDFGANGIIGVESERQAMAPGVQVGTKLMGTAVKFE